MITRTVKVKKVAVSTDGGTTEYVDIHGKKYFRDGRIGTKTPGKIFDRYPGDIGAMGENVDLYEVTDFLDGKATIA